MDRNLLNITLQSNFAAFQQKVFTTVAPGAEFLPNWHIDLLAEYLQACIDGEIKRLIINVPPRAGKSISVSVALPAYLLGLNPSEQIVAASYSHKLTEKNSVDTRLILKSSWYNNLFPGTVIVSDQDTKTYFQTTRRGYRYGTSVGGTATGMGGNFLIIDDPHNPREAASDVQRQHALTWYDQTFSTRLNNAKTGVIILIMQRLHENDLAGHLLERGGWEHLKIQMVSDSDKTYYFPKQKENFQIKEGELLHPERFDDEVVERLKKDLGSYGFAGQMQQEPAPPEGGLFKREWFQEYYTPPLEYEQIVQSWDTAYKDKQINDPSCCLTFKVCKDGIYIIDMFHDRLLYPNLKQAVLRHAEKHQPNAVLIEDKASGQALISDLEQESRLPLIPIKPITDKLTRASTISSFVEAGKIYIPKNAIWKDDLLHELLLFPNSKHDDIVDALSQFVLWLTSFRVRVPRLHGI